MATRMVTLPELSNLGNYWAYEGMQCMDGFAMMCRVQKQLVESVIFMSGVFRGEKCLISAVIFEVNPSLSSKTY